MSYFRLDNATGKSPGQSSVIQIYNTPSVFIGPESSCTPAVFLRSNKFFVLFCFCDQNCFGFCTFFGFALESVSDQNRRARRRYFWAQISVFVIFFRFRAQNVFGVDSAYLLSRQFFLFCIPILSSPPAGFLWPDLFCVWFCVPILSIAPAVCLQPFFCFWFCMPILSNPPTVFSWPFLFPIPDTYPVEPAGCIFATKIFICYRNATLTFLYIEREVLWRRC